MRAFSYDDTPVPFAELLLGCCRFGRRIGSEDDEGEWSFWFYIDEAEAWAYMSTDREFYWSEGELFSGADHGNYAEQLAEAEHDAY